MAKDTKRIWREVSTLEVISAHSPDGSNLVKFIEQFGCNGLTCLVSEMLDRSLSDLLDENEEPWSLNSIRPVAKQLFVALEALGNHSILHTDIKPDNIMVASWQDQYLQVKLIDFANSIPVACATPGKVLQPIGYSAPEVMLGLPFTEAIDFWGVGCTLAALYLADHLFSVDSYYQMMKGIVKLLGQPEDHLLRAGKCTQNYLIEEEAASGPTFRLMMPQEYKAANNLTQNEEEKKLIPSLNALVHVLPKQDHGEFLDRYIFVDLLKQLLQVDPTNRISAIESLLHPFITMDTLSYHSAYFATSQDFMREPWNAETSDAALTSEGRQSSSDCSSDGARVPSQDCNSDAPAAKPPEGVCQKDVKASSGWAGKMLKRFQISFKRIRTPFCICLHPRVEDWFYFHHLMQNVVQCYVNMYKCVYI